MWFESKKTMSTEDKENLIHDLHDVVVSSFPQSKVKLIENTNNSGAIVLHFEVNGEDLIQVNIP